jgi:hypothetical protein
MFWLMPIKIFRSPNRSQLRSNTCKLTLLNHIGNKVKEFKIEEIIKLKNKKLNLHGPTISRRARTIISWLVWLERNTGYIKVIDRKVIVNNIINI